MKRTKSENADTALVADLKSAWQSLVDNQVVPIVVHAQGYGEIMQTIQRKLDAMDTDTKIHFLREVFENDFVYEVQVRNQNGPPEPSYFRREYEVQEDDSIEFMDAPIPVRKNVEFVEINPTSNEEVDTNDGKVKEDEKDKTEKGVTDMSDKTKSPCCEEKVDLLVNSEHTAFTEDDREYLNGLGEERIQTFVQMEHGARTENEAKEGSVQVNKEDLQNPDKFLNMLPAGIQEQMRHGLKLHQEQKQQLVDKITAHGFGFSEDELKGKSLDELEKIAKGIPKVNDYSGLGNPNESVNANGEADEEEPLLPIMDSGKGKE